MNLWTAQYRYSGNDRFDITVKGRENMEFAPTWDMVLSHKNKTMSDEEYTKIYKEMMRKSYVKNKNKWEKLLKRDEITLVCFCKKYNFCHRYILKDILVKMGAVYMGERGFLL